MENDSPTLVREMKGESEKRMESPKNTAILFVGVVLAGIVTGFLISRVAPNSSITPGNVKVGIGGKQVAKGTVVGSKDTKAFPDSAEGKLKEGGIEGEGEFHLERPGGVSQNVYLISSVIDLSEYVGQKVKVWGQTYQPQKAGWFMDVGRLQVQ